jgi:hypothetical protein
MRRRIPALLLALAMAGSLGMTACTVEDDEPTIVETEDDDADVDDDDTDVDVDVEDEETVEEEVPEDEETT